MSKWMEESPWDLKLHKVLQTTKNVENGRNCLPQSKHTTWLSSTTWSALETYMQMKLYTLSGLHLGIYVYIQVCM